ncbi:unnamed protein product [Peronospora destructor]|uniref:26S proteasome regulatory subunit RPN10 n=1 Tax=Peronospora destructor TaxID=86335 RepID=A0AAV0UAG1_9STRA|nr:unnamed protein product [Peronospora destructor]
MPLEATMICLDNSEWMRNGDYIPSRLEAQHDAANLLCGTKTQANPESTVGVLAMAGKSIQVLASPTDDMGTLLSAIHRVEIGGAMKLANAIQVAQLALKHRRNKTGGQRVVVFIGSPIEEDEKQLTKIGKLLKKNNIAVDVVSLGELEANAAKLQAFVDAASSTSNSHLVTVPAGVLPLDVLVSSPVLHGDDGAAATAAAASGGAGGNDSFAEYGGVDPSMDPELALALRVSMEEERARQEAAQKRAAEAEAVVAPATAPILEPPAPSTEATSAPVELKQPTQTPASETAAAATPAATSAPLPAPTSNLPFMDPKFVNSLLSGLPGVDPNDPKIQAAMAQMAKKDENKDGDEENKDDK